MKIHRLLKLLLIGLFFIAGCQNLGADENLESSNHPLRELPFLQKKGMYQQEKEVVPLEVSEATFRSIIGWISDEEILVNEAFDQGSVLFKYNVYSGEKTEDIQLEFSIISTMISPSREFIIIHTAPSPYEANLKVFRTDTFAEVYNENFESSEIVYTWNGNDESKIFVTAFNKDWTYSSYVIRTDLKESQMVDISQPFAEWLDENRLLMLNWDLESPDILAPFLISSDSGLEIVDGGEYYFFKSWSDLILSIGTKGEDFNTAQYTFFNKNLEPIYSFHAPHIAQYSGWMIPHFDYLPELKDFILVEPYKSGEIGVYTGGYKLVKRNIESGHEEIILEKIENQPIACSPDGSLCLFGSILQDIIYLEEGRVEPFIKYIKNREQ